jgi:hypothetical protein
MEKGLVEAQAEADGGDERPTTAKETATPAARASESKRPLAEADPNTIGRMGSTQGESAVSTPAAIAAP